MTIVMELSTDADIVGTPLSQGWPPETARYTWAQVSQNGLNIAAGSTIVIIAHGDGQEIGNKVPGTVDITAAAFLALIVHNVAGAPGRVYLSTCAPGIAQFTADVRLVQHQNGIGPWSGLYGHSDPAAGPVPPPNDIRWTQIF